MIFFCDPAVCLGSEIGSRMVFRPLNLCFRSLRGVPEKCLGKHNANSDAFIEYVCIF